MANRVRRAWEQLRGSLWFVPSISMLVAIALAFGTVALDRRVGGELSLGLPLVFEAGPEGARQVLSTIATSVLTVAGVVFSFTILAFSLASNQYSPRILYSFMDDRTNQTVLGVLLGSFVYCLLVLRTVRVENGSLVDSGFVPALSVTVALLLALLDLGLFVLYLHHIAVSVTAYDILNRVGQAAVNTVRRSFLEEPQHAEEISAPQRQGQQTGEGELDATHSGYLQEIDVESLVKLAQAHHLQLEVARRVGDFITEGKLLARFTATTPLADSARSELVSAFVLGARRTVEHDPLYALVQLSDVAVKALSPGINDPTTAMMCLDQIERTLAAAGKRYAPSPLNYDAEGKLRVVCGTVGFRDLAEQAFAPIRHYGVTEAADARVGGKLLEVMSAIWEQIADPLHRQALYEQELTVVEAADGALKQSAERLMLNEKIAALAAQPGWNGRRLPMLQARED